MTAKGTSVRGKVCERCGVHPVFVHDGKQGKACAICALKMLDKFTGGAVSKYAGLKPPRRKGGKS